MIEDGLRRFILDEIRWGGSPELLTDDYPLIDKQVIDSLGIFQMVSFIETEFGVAVADEDLVLENFGTIASISKLVAAKLPA